MASSTTEIPGPAGKIKCNDALEAEAIGLEIPIRAHGSQVAAVVLDATEHAEPFEENTSTMIVFPRGALVRLRARVRTGHSLVITNSQNHKTATCRIVQVNNPGNGLNYVKLEFIEPVPGFWGVHFPSEPLNATKPQEIVPQTNVAPLKQEYKEPAVSAKPAPATPEWPATPLARHSSEPITQAALPGSEVAVQKSNLAVAKPEFDRSAAEYASSAAAQPELVPLASTPELPKRIRRAAAFSSPVKRQPRTSPQPTSAAESSLSKPKSIGEADFSSLISAAPEKRGSGLWKLLIAASVILSLGAGARYYLRHRSSGVVPTQATAESLAPTQATQQVSTAVPETSIATPAPTPEGQNPPETPAIVRDVPTPAGALAVRGTEKVTPAAHPVISTGTANLYAGDLAAAKPTLRKHGRRSLAAPAAPEIRSSAPDLIAPDAANPLFAADSKLPAPAESAAKPAVAPGGHLVQARLIHSVPPSYPQLAVANHVEGDVKLQAEIDAAGKVISAKVISGPVLLRSAALSAVHQWRYSPAMLDGKPVATHFVVTVIFHLNRN